MAEYHVGCGWAGIYAGTLNKNKTMWNNKSEVTNEAMCAVAQYLMDNNKDFQFEKGGKKYTMHIEELIVVDDPH